MHTPQTNIDTNPQHSIVDDTIPLCVFKPDIAKITDRLQQGDTVYAISTNRNISAHVLSATYFQTLLDTGRSQQASIKSHVAPLYHLSMAQIIPISVFKQQISQKIKALHNGTSHWVVTQNGRPHFIVTTPEAANALITQAAIFQYLGENP